MRYSEEPDKAVNPAAAKQGARFCTCTCTYLDLDCRSSKSGHWRSSCSCCGGLGRQAENGGIVSLAQNEVKEVEVHCRSRSGKRLGRPMQIRSFRNHHLSVATSSLKASNPARGGVPVSPTRKPSPPNAAVGTAAVAGMVIQPACNRRRCTARGGKISIRDTGLPASGTVCGLGSSSWALR